ncbi:MAG: hypothetical protein IMW91_02980 [Firmicutes bacterium]|nr:hypothetical protein [Bacillota bacterium]
MFRLQYWQRIEPDQVMTAFHQTGLTPLQHAYFNEDGSGACAIGALFTLAYGRLPGDMFQRSKQAFDWAIARWGGWYVLGFVRGFDGNQHGLAYHGAYWLSKRFRQGIQDGQQVWQKVQHVLPCTPTQTDRPVVEVA